MEFGGQPSRIQMIKFITYRSPWGFSFDFSGDLKVIQSHRQIQDLKKRGAETATATTGLAIPSLSLPQTRVEQTTPSRSSSSSRVFFKVPKSGKSFPHSPPTLGTQSLHLRAQHHLLSHSPLIPFSYVFGLWKGKPASYYHCPSCSLSCFSWGCKEQLCRNQTHLWTERWQQADSSTLCLLLSQQGTPGKTRWGGRTYQLRLLLSLAKPGSPHNPAGVG